MKINNYLMIALFGDAIGEISTIIMDDIIKKIDNKESKLLRSDSVEEILKIKEEIKVLKDEKRNAVNNIFDFDISNCANPLTIEHKIQRLLAAKVLDQKKLGALVIVEGLEKSLHEVKDSIQKVTI